MELLGVSVARHAAHALNTMLASSCLVSVPSPPSFPHLSSSFHIVSTLLKAWDSSGSHHFSTVLNSHLYYILRLLKVCPCTFVVFRCFVVESTRVHISAIKSICREFVSQWIPANTKITTLRQACVGQQFLEAWKHCLACQSKDKDGIIYVTR